MPRKKNAAKGKTTEQAPQRRSTRQKAPKNDGVPDIYTEMLVEAYREDPDSFALDPRPSKRRKIDEPEPQVATSPKANESTPPSSSESRQHQVIFQNDFDDSDESDVEFEDVEIDREYKDDSSLESERRDREPLQIDLAPVATLNDRRPINRRKPVTKAERLHRLDVHKWHTLLLLMHVAIRNQWCDNQMVQKTLKPLVPRKTISRLHLDESKSQAERKFSFDQAIEQICQIWRAHWKVDSRGMRRAFWREHIDLEKELDESLDPIDLDDFKQAAKACEGSRDLGAQLLCALLRAVAVETRLVCSLQVLPFSSVAKGETPQKAAPTYIQAGSQNFGTSQSRTSTKPKRKDDVQESPYPIFWVEVLNPAITQWIPLDPVVRNTINKPRTGFEPPASDNLNSMCYVIAFEEDGTAKDVTRRYTSSYNAKTRKARIESTHHGEKWWDRVMSHFDKPLPEARDDIEEAALSRQVAIEGMPKNVQDFKDHPVYVLERHLRMSEVIHPKREAGKFAVGVGKNQKVESVYRRQDVYSCKSADAWYRRGRDVRAGEVPLKRIVSRNDKLDDTAMDDDDRTQSEGTPLYAEYQTDIYIPPPVVDDRVPRNGYGNLDIYVQSMIPAGAVHFRHPLASQAARALKIDFAEAVTGFSFKARQGTAIVDGIVVSAQHTASLSTLTRQLEADLEEKICKQRSTILLLAWKKMLAVLRVRQRVHDEYGEKTDDVSENAEDDDDDPTYRDEVDGGFIPDANSRPANGTDQDDVALSALRDKQPIVLPPLVNLTPVTIVRSLHKVESTHEIGEVSKDQNGMISRSHSRDVPYDPGAGGGFLVDDEDENRLSQIEQAPQQRFDSLFEASSEASEHAEVPAEIDYMEGGGFLIGDAEEDIADVESSNAQKVNDDETQLAIHVQEVKSLNLGSGENGTLNGPGGLLMADLTTKNANEQEKLETRSNISDLSHDPEEDDLEPEWLADAFED